MLGSVRQPKSLSTWSLTPKLVCPELSYLCHGSFPDDLARNGTAICGEHGFEEKNYKK